MVGGAVSALLSTDTSKQIGLIKNLGLDGIRTEGHQMPDGFYQQMDRAGILIDGGFQCCDAWQLPATGKGVTEHDYQVLYRSALTIARQLRNHPSMMNFSWSDNAPTRRQEAVSLRGFRKADFREPLISSAEYKSSPSLARQVRRKDLMTGSRLGTGTTPPTSTPRRRTGPTPADRGGSTARRVPGTPCRRWFDPPVHVSV